VVTNGNELSWYKTQVHGQAYYSPTRNHSNFSYKDKEYKKLFTAISHLFLSPAILISESFAVSILTSIPKQPVPSLPLVHSKLDYCNSLYYNLPKSQINRLQQIQNCLARTVVKAPRSSHITPILRSLHWLKINECIEYKLLSLTYKFLTTSQPDYLSMFSPPQGGHVRPPVVVWHFAIVPGRRLPSCHR